jgi:SAM-dependent methyltransferase
MQDNNIWLDMTEDKINFLKLHWGTDIQHVLAALDKLNLSGDLVIDVGCGVGMYYPYLKSKYTEYEGVDSSPIMLEQFAINHPGVELLHHDLFTLSEVQARADLIFCWSVLIHLTPEDKAKALDELNKIKHGEMIYNLYAWEHPTLTVTDIEGAMGATVTIYNRDEIPKDAIPIMDMTYQGKGFKEYLVHEVMK